MDGKFVCATYYSRIFLWRFCVVTLFFYLSVGVRAFEIGLSQIFSFFSWYYVSVLQLKCSVYSFPFWFDVIWFCRFVLSTSFKVQYLQYSKESAANVYHGRGLSFLTSCQVSSKLRSAVADKKSKMTRYICGKDSHLYVRIGPKNTSLVRFCFLSSVDKFYQHLLRRDEHV